MLIRMLENLCILTCAALWIAGCTCDNKTTSEGEHSGTERGRQGPVEKALSAKERNTELVRVGDRVITLADFARTLDHMSPYIRARFRSPERRRELLDNMVEFELLVAEAKRLGLDKLPSVEKLRRKLSIEAMLQESVEAKVSEKKFSDAEVKEFYDAHRSEFSKPEQVHAFHVLLPSRSEALEVIRMARPGDRERFEDLAHDYTHDLNTKAEGGDLGFFSRDEDSEDRPASLVQAAFALKEAGDLYPAPVRTPRGFHVVMLAQRRPALSRTLSEASRMIRNRLYRRERDRLIKQLIEDEQKHTKVTKNMKLLEQVEVGK